MCKNSAIDDDDYNHVRTNTSSFMYYHSYKLTHEENSMIVLLISDICGIRAVSGCMTTDATVETQSFYTCCVSVCAERHTQTLCELTVVDVSIVRRE
jgi:hypothetical protein